MNRLVGADFDALFVGFEHTAWRLETRDAYLVDDEVAPLRAFLAGDDVDLAWFAGWLETIRSAVARGRRFERVRVVPEPLTDYLRFEAWLCQYNVAAGEDIRYMPLDQARALGLPDDDFWLFDSRRLARLHFDDAGRPQGAEMIDDAGAVARAEQIRAVAWPRAIPFQQWYRPETIGRDERPGRA